MIADLVVLDANPLDDVKNMSAINRVLRRGHAFTVEELVHL